MNRYRSERSVLRRAMRTSEFHDSALLFASIVALAGIALTSGCGSSNTDPGPMGEVPAAGAGGDGTDAARGTGGRGNDGGMGGAGTSGAGGRAMEGRLGGSDSAGGRDGARDADAVDASNPASCNSRPGGAAIDFRICGQSLRLFVTNAAFITEAMRLLANGQMRIACFPVVLDGRDCDPVWTWHTDPTRPYWTDFELETYFACPQDVEAHKVDWVEQIGQYCGEITTVTAVRDNR